MEKLTVQEEEAMLYIWELENCFVKDIVTKYSPPAPPYTTVASIMKNLERKKYICATRVGNTYQYTPLIRESDYKRTFMSGFVRNYFENSFKEMVSFFAKEQKISTNDLKDIIEMIEKGKEKLGRTKYLLFLPLTALLLIISNIEAVACTTKEIATEVMETADIPIVEKQITNVPEVATEISVVTGKIKLDSLIKEKNVVFEVVEDMPQFPRSTEGLMRYISITEKAQERSKEYLQIALANIENIKSAKYFYKSENWGPGDTLPLSVYSTVVKEMTFPQDTTIGSLFIYSPAKSPEQIESAYNGVQEYMFFHEKKGVIIDDFTYRPLPFRPIQPPFFNFCKNIIAYTLSTKDNIRFNLKEEENHYHFKLTIEEEEQVEFFGNAYHIPKPPFYTDPLSIYEIWINKSDNLPYKVRREMSHDISVYERLETEFNKLLEEDFDITKYIPKDYEIRTAAENQNKNKSKPSQSDLTGKTAPIWTLNNPDCQAVSINDFKSKVLVICVTGIGCGACQAAVPFLQEFKTRFSENAVNLVAIECWSRRESAVKVYADRKQLNYLVLTGTDQFIKDYQTGGSAPWFFILDKDRIIRKTIRGYGGERTNKEILEAIAPLL